MDLVDFKGSDEAGDEAEAPPTMGGVRRKPANVNVTDLTPELDPSSVIVTARSSRRRSSIFTPGAHGGYTLARTESAEAAHSARRNSFFEPESLFLSDSAHAVVHQKETVGQLKFLQTKGAPAANRQA